MASNLLKMSLFVFVIFIIFESTLSQPIANSDEDDDTVVVGEEDPFTTSNKGNEEDPKVVCEMPKLTGPCRASMRRWHYDPELKQCMPFTYGGCLKNANNFFTKKDCMEMCKNR